MPQRRTSFVQCPATTADTHDIGQVTIDMLPDVVLLQCGTIKNDNFSEKIKYDCFHLKGPEKRF